MLFPGDHVRRSKPRHGGSYVRASSRAYRFMVTAVVLMAAAVLAWPFAEPFLLKTEAVTLSGADLPEGIGSLRIVYLTDLHTDAFLAGTRVNGLINQVNSCGADLVLLGGDYASDTESAAAFFGSMPRLHARYGVYAVMGSSDRSLEGGSIGTLRAAMLGAGVTPLVNSVNAIRIGTDTIYVAGLDDAEKGSPAIAALAAQVRAEDYVILVSHSPAVIEESLFARDAAGKIGWFDLGLFGKTHGGQIGFLPRFICGDEVPGTYLKGWAKQNRVDLLISSGVGTEKAPIRMFCPPQIHLITVRSE